MKKVVLIIAVSLLSGLFAFPSFAQNESDERALLNVENGISISKDSLFKLNLRFRMQNRFGVRTESGEDLSIEQTDFRVRRMRLRLDGYVLNPRIQYYIQLGFSKADMDLDGGGFAQPIRDAIIHYYFTPNLYVGFGQAKLPGNRERVISSGNLQFIDRSIANGIFTLDRDFGFFAYYTLPTKGRALYQLKGAISTGEGRNPSPGDEGLSYTGRLELLPFGKFKNSGDYSEGDLEFEPTPKLGFGITFNSNKKAVRSRGQLGPDLYQQRDQRVFIADAMFKYQGWGVMAEYFQRSSNDPITRNSIGATRVVWVGRGHNFQASKMISKKSEMAFRYAQVIPDEEIKSFENQGEELALGFSRYLNGHRIKIQGNVGYGWSNNTLQLINTSNFWFGVFQVEFGI
ncbi:porin [Algoriphagus sp. AK58]|uniref:porin n=1 Tax=Algoriphagus sp. AK58 TaxID=1406877 RepID=UPI00164F9BB0|nr:porin [Algoriphagus sp. AK58]MBC6368592.1 porin [Algoriphagus sp. AK58]